MCLASWSKSKDQTLIVNKKTQYFQMPFSTFLIDIGNIDVIGEKGDMGDTYYKTFIQNYS